MDIGEYIKQLRTKKGISQEELGKVVGVQRAAVQKWEAGKVQNLKRSTIQMLANYFNVNPVNFVVNDDISLDNTLLSKHEKEVITAYRNQPTMQEAVDRLLGIQEEETVVVFKAARSKDNTPPGYSKMSKSDIDKLESAPETDDKL